MLHLPTAIVRFTLPLLGALALAALFGTAGATAEEPQLSAAQSKAVKEQIATLKTPAGRQLASKWSNAKKVAEVMCRPLALETLKKRVPGTDKVFLGSGDPDSLTLSSNQLLSGSGELRLGNDWKQFRFDCHLNADTGKATAFRVSFQNSGSSASADAD